jgi:uncharacterized protein (TIGR02611 family)
MAEPHEVARFIGRSGRRVAVTVLGSTLIGVGVVLLVIPGPGLLLIIAGLAVLATEYAWARRALDSAKARAQKVRSRIRRPTNA